MLVIFDCDGVLVDSEPIANESFSQALRSHGLDWTVEETMRRLMGRSLKSAVEICEAEIGRKLPDDFVDKQLPRSIRPFHDKLFGLTIDPDRLQQIREARRPASKYASLDNCRYEVREALALMQREQVPVIDTTSRSIEEISTTILHRAGLQRHIF